MALLQMFCLIKTGGKIPNLDYCLSWNLQHIFTQFCDDCPWKICIRNTWCQKKIRINSQPDKRIVIRSTGLVIRRTGDFCFYMTNRQTELSSLVTISCRYFILNLIIYSKIWWCPTFTTMGTTMTKMQRRRKTPKGQNENLACRGLRH